MSVQSQNNGKVKKLNTRKIRLHKRSMQERPVSKNIQ